MIFPNIKETFSRIVNHFASNDTDKREADQDTSDQSKTNQTEQTSDNQESDVNKSLNEFLINIQIGFGTFTTSKKEIGFYIDPDNRWVKLADRVFFSELDDVYKNRMVEMRKITKGTQLAKKLEKLPLDKEYKEHYEQLILPNIDSAVSQAVDDTAPMESGMDAEVSSNAGRPPFEFRLACGILMAQSIFEYGGDVEHLGRSELNTFVAVK